MMALLHYPAGCKSQIISKLSNFSSIPTMGLLPSSCASWENMCCRCLLPWSSTILPATIPPWLSCTHWTRVWVHSEFGREMPSISRPNSLLTQTRVQCVHYPAGCKSQMISKLSNFSSIPTLGLLPSSYTSVLGKHVLSASMKQLHQHQHHGTQKLAYHDGGKSQ